MNNSLLIVACCVTSCWLSIQTSEAAASDEGLAKSLTTAIERLDQQSSYHWTTAVEVPVENRFRPGRTLGTVRDDKTHIVIPLGPRSVHVVIDGDQATVTVAGRRCG